MASHKEIHSTEKLLELIRDEGERPSELSQSQPPAKATLPASKNRSTIISMAVPKKYTIGVDIGHTYIKLAKVAHLSAKQFELVDYRTVRPNWSFSLQDKKFQDLLESTLDEFCADGTRHDIWAAIPSANVETRYLRIPKLPRKQVPNAIFWTFTKMVEFNAANEILDFEILGDLIEQGVKKTEVMAFKVPKNEVAGYKEVFGKIGWSLKGISIVPFAVQNLFRADIVTHAEEDVCSLFVGRDWSRIAIFNHGNLVLSRGIRAGMQSMVEAIHQALHKPNTWGLPPDSDEASATTGSESTFIHPDAQKAFLNLMGIATPSAQPSLPNSEPEPVNVFQMLLPAMERLIRQVERTFEHYAQTFHREGVRRIFLSGQISANTAIATHIGRQLDLPVTVLNPFAPETPFSEKVTIPETQDERESYAPAIGLAMSSNALTPNVLFTHADREQAEAVRRLNMRVLGGCMACLLVLIGYFSWQGRQLDAQRDIADKLTQKLAVYQPPAEKELMLAMFAKTKDKRQTLDRIAGRYTPVAVISELSQVTPSTIRLLNLDLSLPRIEGKKPGPASRSIAIEGLVFGTNAGFETTLTSYLLTLKNSAVFLKPEIVSRQVEYYNDQEVLRFKAKLEVL